MICEGALLTIILGYLFILLGQHHVSLRALRALPLAWEAKGIDEASRWIGATVRRATAGRLEMTGSLGVGVRCALGLLLLLLAVRGGTWEIFRAESTRELDLKDAGVWLAQHRPGPKKKTMGYDHVVPYYAGGTRFVFPVTESARLALEYVRAEKPDYLVLTRDVGPGVPYYQDWVDRGIPDSAARLIYRAGRARDREVMIYEMI